MWRSLALDLKDINSRRYKQSTLNCIIWQLNYQSAQSNTLNPLNRNFIFRQLFGIWNHCDVRNDRICPWFPWWWAPVRPFPAWLKDGRLGWSYCHRIPSIYSRVDSTFSPSQLLWYPLLHINSSGPPRDRRNLHHAGGCRLLPRRERALLSTYRWCSTPLSRCRSSSFSTQLWKLSPPRQSSFGR